ncbi:hypothetical protein AGLY_009611 [Aphis glycines]|uniref:Uncharacterized protein n=1 Tax=Aphis glycines TaxID=307491 RepID=A0A6G0TGI3_APHGL|nr:hypothetical protein AGLY_009611 [Aphis glycines]
MLKTCFGCCPLHHGVSAIALINIIWNVTELLKHIYHRTEQYERFNWVYHSNNNSSVSPDDNSTAEEDSDYWSDTEKIPVMSGIYMDYIFIITVSWVVLEFISNCCLKQSTFKRAPQKIYAWLVVYYGNLVFMALHLVHYLILMMRNPILVNTFFSMVKQHFGHFFLFLITLIIMSDFIHRLSNYYQYYEHTSLENTTSQTLSPDLYPDEDILLNFNSTSKDLYQPKIIAPLLSVKYLFYLLTIVKNWTRVQLAININYLMIMCTMYMHKCKIKLGWSVMEFYLNISLKESTYSVSPEKIYAWLVIYYFNLGSSIIYQISIIFPHYLDQDLQYFIGFIEIIILVVEIYIVQSYYKQQKLAAVSDFVQLKWKYLPNKKTQSGQNKSTVIIIAENQESQDESSYIPIFIKELRHVNS